MSIRIGNNKYFLDVKWNLQHYTPYTIEVKHRAKTEHYYEHKKCEIKYPEKSLNKGFKNG